MRDPKRIDKFLMELKLLWESYPDLRFFQLIEWLRSKVDINHNSFYLEDEDLLKLFKGVSIDRVLMTPNDWLTKWKFTIMDADGWHNSDWMKPISEQEFFDRAAECTCNGNFMAAFDKWNKDRSLKQYN